MAGHPRRAADGVRTRAARSVRGLGRLRPPPRPAAVLVLALATAIWGASFVVAKGLVDRYDPMSVLALRFAIGTVTLVALRPGAIRALDPADRTRAALIGLLIGAAQVPHYFGVRESSASSAAFLIGTYVVATPIIDRLLFKVRTTATAGTGAALALGGLALFAAGGTVSALGLGLCLAAAILYAAHLAAVGAWVPASNLWGFTTTTLATITVVVAVPAGLRGLELPTSAPDWLSLLYLALVAGVAAVAMQAWSQRRIPATQAAVILVMEPIWAAGLAVLVTDEILNLQLLLGGAVLLVANLLVARGSRRSPQATESPHTWA